MKKVLKDFTLFLSQTVPYSLCRHVAIVFTGLIHWSKSEIVKSFTPIKNELQIFTLHDTNTLVFYTANGLGSTTHNFFIINMPFNLFTLYLFLCVLSTRLSWNVWFKQTKIYSFSSKNAGVNRIDDGTHTTQNLLFWWD